MLVTSFLFRLFFVFLATTSAWSLSFSATWCPQKESWVSTCVRPDLASIHNYGTPPFPPINIIIINTINTYLLVWSLSCLSNNHNHIIINFSSHSCIQNRKLHGKEADWCPWSTSPSTTFLSDHHHVCYIYHNHNIVILISFSPHSCIQFVKFHGREADAHEQHQ